MTAAAEYPVSHIERLELTFAPKRWDFAVKRRAEIDAQFATLQRANPALFNGQVLLLHEHLIAGGVLHGRFLETDYASFTAWRKWGRPDSGVMGCFGAAAVASADGAFLLGVMAAHTANAGQIYFPCGTPDPGDVIEGRVDLDHSVARELREETGLAVEAFEREPGWTMVGMPGQFALIKLLRARESAADLQTRVLEHLARERQPELVSIRMVRALADLEPQVSPFVGAFLAQRWA